jgi:hypothetical protein
VLAGPWRYIVLERTEVAIRATLLDGSAEGARKPDEWITGPGERRYLEEHGFIWRDRDNKCLFSFLGMARQCPIRKSPPSPFVDEADDPAWGRQGQEGSAQRDNHCRTNSDFLVLREDTNSECTVRFPTLEPADSTMEGFRPASQDNLVAVMVKALWLEEHH